MQGMLNTGARSLRRDTVVLYGRLNLGATGAITTQTKRRSSGFTVARTGAGVYTITLGAKYSELLRLTATIVGANATYTAAAGREVYISSDLTTTTGIITIRFMRTDTGAVAELEDNAKVLIELALAQSAAEVA